MAQTLELRLVDPHNHYDLAFTQKLRNDNAEFFFNSAQVNWFEHCQWIMDKCKQPNFAFFIIWSGKHRAGTIAVEHGESCEFLQNLCIVPEFRGKGIAKWAITYLRKRGRFIVAQVKSDNKKVIKMYQEIGFWRVR